MWIKRLIDKLRAKGYDDFYMANLASTHDWMWFFFIGLLQIAVIIGVLKLLMIMLCIQTSIIPDFMCISPTLLFFVSWAPCASIQTSKDKGESDLRITYVINSWICKFMLKVFRYAPVISMILLPIVFVSCIIAYGFHWQMLLTSAIGIVLLLVFSSIYHKLMNRISKEGAYYVDWKTNQEVEHFEEMYSRHEKWWLSESEMTFEKFNVDRYRSIRLTAFIGTFGSMFAGIIFVFSFSPLFGANLDASAKKQDNVEQTTHVEHINEVQLEAPKTSSEANAEPADADVVEDEDPIGDGKVPSEGPAEETQTESTEVLSLSEVDDMPTMADGSNITQGISAYLKSHIPELSKKKVYVEFKISETGHIYDVDASLVSDARVKSKIEKLLTTIKVKPGRKDGHVVTVKTSLNI